MPDTQPNLVVEVVGLTKIFKDFWGRPKARAVNSIDFSIKQGEVFGLLEKIIGTEFDFADKDEARRFFLTLTQTFKDWHQAPAGSEQYAALKAKIGEILAGAARKG